MARRRRQQVQWQRQVQSIKQQQQQEKQPSHRQQQQQQQVLMAAMTKAAAVRMVPANQRLRRCPVRLVAAQTQPQQQHPPLKWARMLPALQRRPQQLLVLQEQRGRAALQEVLALGGLGSMQQWQQQSRQQQTRQQLRRQQQSRQPQSRQQQRRQQSRMRVRSAVML
jgi:hypothetical protein